MEKSLIKNFMLVKPPCHPQTHISTLKFIHVHSALCTKNRYQSHQLDETGLSD